MPRTDSIGVGLCRVHSKHSDKLNLPSTNGALPTTTREHTTMTHKLNYATHDLLKPSITNRRARRRAVINSKRSHTKPARLTGTLALKPTQQQTGATVLDCLLALTIPASIALLMLTTLALTNLQLDYHADKPEVYKTTTTQVVLPVAACNQAI